MDTGVSIVQVLLAFAFVVALIGLLGVALKRFGIPGQWAAKPKGQARLQVVETCFIDPRRKLLLVRHDDKEHLLLIGQDSQLLIESSVPARKETI